MSFKYDPFGRRFEKTVTEEDDWETKTKAFTYVYDNEDIILEILTTVKGGWSRTETARYTHGPGIDEPLAIEKKGEIFFYHADGLGSVTALTDGWQRVVKRYDYDSFGNLRGRRDYERDHDGYDRSGDDDHDESNVKNAFTFTGREWDKEIELYYYRARYYDATTGRFTAFDPILGGAQHTEANSCRQSVSPFPLQSPQELNRYGYVANNPLSFIDPQGLSGATERRLNCFPKLSASSPDPPAAGRSTFVFFLGTRTQLSPRGGTGAAGGSAG